MGEVSDVGFWIFDEGNRLIKRKGDLLIIVIAWFHGFDIHPLAIRYIYPIFGKYVAKDTCVWNVIFLH